MQQESPLLSPTREGTNGSDLKSIAIRTISAGVQLEMGDTYRESLLP